jgi:hypothetical protein
VALAGLGYGPLPIPWPQCTVCYPSRNSTGLPRAHGTVDYPSRNSTGLSRAHGTADYPSRGLPVRSPTHPVILVRRPARPGARPTTHPVTSGYRPYPSRGPRGLRGQTPTRPVTLAWLSRAAGTVAYPSHSSRGLRVRRPNPPGAPAGSGDGRLPIPRSSYLRVRRLTHPASPGYGCLPILEPWMAPADSWYARLPVP